MTKYRRQADGFTLAEMIVSLAMLGIITAGTGIYLANLEKSRYRMEAIATRDAMGLRLKRLTTLSIIEYSAKKLDSEPGNAQLKGCLLGAGCTATNPLNPMAFTMAYPKSGEIVRIAGTEQKPVIYCHDGREKTADNVCTAEWVAKAYFVALCPFGNSTCDRASAIRISHKLENTSLKGQPLLDSLGLKDESGGVFTTIQVPQELKRTRNPCNQFSIIDNVDKDGKVTCKCLPGMQTLPNNPANNQPNCEPRFNGCPPPQVTVGYGPNFERRCANPATSRVIILSDQCDGFITEVLVSGCTTNTSGGEKGKGGKKGGTTSDTTCAVDIQRCVKPTPL